MHCRLQKLPMIRDAAVTTAPGCAVLMGHGEMPVKDSSAGGRNDVAEDPAPVAQVVTMTGTVGMRRRRNVASPKPWQSGVWSPPVFNGAAAGGSTGVAAD